jgi:hypothetical protein
MLRLYANRLQAPRLRYRSATKKQPPYAEKKAVDNGSWLLRDLLLSTPGKGKRWSWIEISSRHRWCDDGERAHFLTAMEAQLAENCTFQDRRCLDCPSDCPRSAPNNASKCHFIHDHKNTLAKRFRHFKEQDISILFVILPDRDAAT